MEYYQKLGLKNQFENKVSGDSVNFRNDTNARDNVSSIEITKKNPWVSLPGSQHIEFKADVEDNVAMALSLLGVGRVTEDVEERAQSIARGIVRKDYVDTEDESLAFAVTNLRAILIARQLEQEAASKDVEEAYRLYKFAYPNSSKTLEDFKELEMKNYWIPVVKKIREDPTVLGSL